MSEEIINKVAASPLLQVDLEAYLPKDEIAVFDLKPHLFMELILKEKDFRASLQGLDWSVYQGMTVAVTCSADAVIPMWAYMLVASYLQPLAREIIFGDRKEAEKQLFLKNINSIDAGLFEDKRVVVKGCGDREIEPFAYLEIAKKLRPVAKSIMYGEPCSTVPIYKKK
ncbi:MAG TPA: DUF2480 family protein [Flavitalea sp.]|nr:DUF2480 family protein [Flavitalea sp.]